MDQDGSQTMQRANFSHRSELEMANQIAAENLMAMRRLYGKSFLKEVLVMLGKSKFS